MAEIAERELEKIYKDGGVARVRVVVNAPQRRYDRKPGESEWICLYRIAGLDELVSEYVSGSDAVDSLDASEPLTWDGKPGHGFGHSPAIVP